MYMSLRTLDGWQHSPVEAMIRMPSMDRIQVIGRFPLPECKDQQFYMGLHADDKINEPPSATVPVDSLFSSSGSEWMTATFTLTLASLDGGPL